MKVSYLPGSLVCLLLVVCDVSLAEETEEKAPSEGPEGVIEDEGVIVLTDDNFREVALSKPIILVEFYAPWCGHCKTLAPHYAKAAQRLQTNSPPIPLAKLDATEHKESSQEYGISGFPTLKVFRNGLAYDYEGPRDEEGIVKYMEEQADPSWKPPPERVVALTTAEFDEFVNTHPLVLLEFYAPWCGHCKKLAPELEKAAAQLDEEGLEIVIAKVDATEEADLATRFQVSGYPTMFVMRYGIRNDYDGPRDSVGIAKYMREKAEPTSVELKTLKEVKEYRDYLEDLSIIGFFTGEDDPMYKLFVDTANAINEEYRFGYTFLDEARQFYKVNAGEIVLFHSTRYHSKYDKTRYVFDQKVNVTFDTLLDWFRAHDLQLVGQMIDSVVERWFRGTAVVVVYYKTDWSLQYQEDTEFWRQKVLEVASDPEFQDYTFAIADEEEFYKFLVELGLDDSGNDVNVGLYDTHKKRYAMDPDEEFSVEGLREFLHEFKKGNLKNVVKSQPKPRDNTGPVRIIIGKTFEDEVLKTENGVFLEVYAPWCGHCKKLEPIFKKLGKKYKDNDKVVIAKMDGTQNDLPLEFFTEGYPSLFFIKGGDLGTLVKYDGQRNVDDMSAFIDEHMSPAAESTKDEL